MDQQSVGKPQTPPSLAERPSPAGIPPEHDAAGAEAAGASDADDRCRPLRVGQYLRGEAGPAAREEPVRTGGPPGREDRGPIPGGAQGEYLSHAPPRPGRHETWGSGPHATPTPPPARAAPPHNTHHQPLYQRHSP